MGLDCRFTLSEPILWLTEAEYLAKEEDPADWHYYENDYRAEFEGERCYGFLEALKQIIPGGDVNCRDLELTPELLRQIIENLNQKGYVKLGWFFSKQQMIRVLQDVKSIVERGGSASFYCWY